MSAQTSLDLDSRRRAVWCDQRDALAPRARRPVPPTCAINFTTSRSIITMNTNSQSSRLKAIRVSHAKRFEGGFEVKCSVAHIAHPLTHNSKMIS